MTSFQITADVKLIWDQDIKDNKHNTFIMFIFIPEDSSLEHPVHGMIHFIVLDLFEVNNQLDSNYSTTNNRGYLLSLEHFITILLI